MTIGDWPQPAPAQSGVSKLFPQRARMADPLSLSFLKQTLELSFLEGVEGDGGRGIREEHGARRVRA